MYNRTYSKNFNEANTLHFFSRLKDITPIIRYIWLGKILGIEIL